MKKLFTLLEKALFGSSNDAMKELKHIRNFIALVFIGLVLYACIFTPILQGELR